MSLHFKIGNESLDLQGVILETQEQNPYLQFTEGVQGPYSLPFNIPYTDRNVKLLQYAPLLPVKRKGLSVPVQCIEHGITHSNGTLKIDSFESNLNRAAESSMSWYYTFGIGTFYDLIKDKRLPELDYGAAELHTYTGWSYSDTGFWAHIHRVLHANPGIYKYALFPVKNTDDIDPVRSDYLSIYNNVYEDSAAPYGTVLRGGSVQRIVPFPYLKNTLETVFKSVGWTVEGEVLSDPEFAKICLLNSYQVSWWPSRWNNSIPINIDLSNHVPNVLISKFLISLKTRMGWWYDWDYIKKKCTISYIDDVFKNRGRKDFTPYAAASYALKVESESKIYSLQGSQESTPPDLSNVKYQGTIARRLNLPAASAERLDHCYMVANENAFYYCIANEDDSTYGWERLSSAVTAYIPDGATDTITTDCNIPHLTESVVYRHITPISGTDFRMMVQEISLPADNDLAEYFYITYQHGPVNIYWKDGSASAIKYPYGSPHNYDAVGNKLQQQVLNWSFVDHVTQKEIGVYFQSWQSFLSFLVQNEISTFRLHISFVDMLKLSWMDDVIIKNTQWFIKTKKRVLAYPGYIDCELIRI